ncbi:hypothetical protein SLEP1_g29786 [Rubroshorea leprosula]|uniref:Xylanase inhibitor C-terminal domain-containing protein n=1 Tax=Rubroshorea leprosula TaxID=152421 RepID=A0AAV5K0J1_9ROSI|nr:hypothetical protein SLEP1_g29786 [Rubroshorea leprosula]
MASSFLLFLFSIAIVSLSSSNNAAALTDPKPKALILSVAGPSCGSTASTSHPLTVQSLVAPQKCQAVGGLGCLSCNGTPRPRCTNNNCVISPYNSFINRLLAGGLGKDASTLYSTGGTNPTTIVTAKHYPFVTQLSASTQLSSAFNIPLKFAIGLPSTESTDGYLGDIFIGGDPYNYKMLNDTYKDMSKTLTKTPLVTNPVSTAPIYSEGVGGTKLSTIFPYTVLHTSIYKALVKDFEKRAASKKIAGVTPVKPFGSYFNSKTIRSTVTGRDVPKTDLVLQSSSVHWRIYRHNSMVKVKKDVMCLAFVDGGLNPRTAIVIGGHQLEDNLLQFDLAASKIGFSSPLLLKNTNCSQFRTVIF